jgi:predicted GH43/DUF377 family glycosyl hydrolase
MIQWKKLGNIFNPIEHREVDWIFDYAQAPSVINCTDYIRVFFSSRRQPDANGNFVSNLGFADFTISKDEKFNVINKSSEPIIELGGLGAFDEFGIYPASIIKIKDTLYLYYAGWTRCESVPFNAAIGGAKSNNMGLSFEKFGPGPVLSYTPDEPFVLGSPKIRFYEDKWYLWYSCGRAWIENNGSPQPIYKIRMAISEDGINWSRIGKDIIPDCLEVNECQAGADVFYHNGRYHMFFSYRFNLDFKTQGRGYRIGYAYSNNLIDWVRNDEIVGISTSKSGWDSESISYSHLFSYNEQIYMLYQGNEIGKYGFGVSKLLNESLL